MQVAGLRRGGRLAAAGEGTTRQSGRRAAAVAELSGGDGGGGGDGADGRPEEARISAWDESCLN